MKRELNVDYDEVVIIDTLPESQYDKFQIVQELSKFLVKSEINHKIVTSRNRKEVLEGFQYLVNLAASGVKFCLHIVSHGSDEGLWLAETAEDVYWQELRVYLSPINTLMEGQLIVNMTSCWGLHGAKIVDEKAKVLPFFGLIGYSEKLYVPVSKQINELFYTKWLVRKPINIIVQEIRAELADDRLYCISAIGYRAIKNAMA